MIACIFFSMAAPITAYLKILIGCWRISTNKKMAKRAAMESKAKGTMWKSIKTVLETSAKSDPAFSGQLSRKQTVRPWWWVSKKVYSIFQSMSSNTNSFSTLNSGFNSGGGGGSSSSLDLAGGGGDLTTLTNLQSAWQQSQQQHGGGGGGIHQIHQQNCINAQT